MRAWRVLQQTLTNSGLPAEVASLDNADMNSKHRATVLDGASNGTFVVLFCTVGFGLGLDLSSVARVVNWGDPRDPAMVYQQVGVPLNILLGS